MTQHPQGPPEAGDPPAEEPVPPPEFLAELAEAFRRLRPQGSAEWNFSDAFTRLETQFGSGRGAVQGLPVRPGSAPAAPPSEGRGATGWCRPAWPIGCSTGRWPTDCSAGSTSAPTAAARRATEEALAEGLAGVAGGFDATVEAFRFLAARVEGLEDAAGTRRASAVDGVAWLVPPPALSTGPAPVARGVGVRPGRARSPRRVRRRRAHLGPRGGRTRGAGASPAVRSPGTPRPAGPTSTWGR